MTTATQLPAVNAWPTLAGEHADVTLCIGRHQPIAVASAEEASRIWQLYRDALNLGGSDSPNALLKVGHRTIGYVSYNGRIWKGRPTDPVEVQNKRKPIAEAADVRHTGIRVGDCLPVEDMVDGILFIGRVTDIHRDERALTIKGAGRVVYMPMDIKKIERYFTHVPYFDAL